MTMSSDAVDFTGFWHPVIAVACPDCGRRAGAMCVRPSGHRAADFHKARKDAADAVFIHQHGEDAWIENLGGAWRIYPTGRDSGHSANKACAELPLFKHISVALERST